MQVAGHRRRSNKMKSPQMKGHLASASTKQHATSSIDYIAQEGLRLAGPLQADLDARGRAQTHRHWVELRTGRCRSRSGFR